MDVPVLVDVEVAAAGAALEGSAAFAHETRAVLGALAEPPAELAANLVVDVHFVGAQLDLAIVIVNQANPRPETLCPGKGNHLDGFLGGRTANHGV